MAAVRPVDSGGGGKAAAGYGEPTTVRGAAAPSRLSEQSDTNRHNEVVSFFRKIWGSVELPEHEQQPPRPSQRARDATRAEVFEWYESLDGAPKLHSRRFFLVEYGIEHLTKVLQQRSLHVQLVAYVIFVVLFLAYVFETVTLPGSYGMHQALRDRVTEFKFATGAANETAEDIKLNYLFNLDDRTQIWNWVEHGLVGSPEGPFSESGCIGEWNKVLGAVRLRQVRLDSDTCASQIPLTAEVISCYGVAQLDSVNQSAFGPGTSRSIPPDLLPERVSGYYSYRDSTSLSMVNGIALTPPHNPLVLEYGSYDQGGFVIDLPVGNRSAALSIIGQLREDGWLDDATAAVFVTFPMYNPNVNIFAFVRINIEFTRGGLVRSSVIFRPFRFPGNNFKKSDQQAEWVVFAFFAINVFVWLFKLVYGACSDARSLDAWDLLDLLNLVLLSVQLTQRIVWLSILPEITQFTRYAGGTDYIDYEQISFLFEYERWLAGINAITVFIKFFKLTRVIMRLSVIVHVLSEAAQSLFAWLICAGAIFMGYALMGFIMFGSTLASFKTLGDTMLTLFNYIVGHYNNVDVSLDPYAGNGLESLTYVAGHQEVFFLVDPSFFFSTFNVIFYFFALRIMIAMLVTAYTTVSREMERQETLASELAEYKENVQKMLPATFRSSVFGRFARSYLFAGIIPGCYEPPSEKHVLARLKGEEALLEKGYLSYPELQSIVEEVITSRAPRCCGRSCGRPAEEADPELVEHICIELLTVQQINLHRVPQIMGMLNDMAVEDNGQQADDVAGALHGADDDALDGAGKEHDFDSHSRDEPEHDGEEDSKLQADVGADHVDLEWIDPHNLVDWNVDIMSGDALHSVIYVYRQQLLSRYQKFKTMLLSQDTALRSLMSEVLDVEKQMDLTYKFFHGAPPAQLPYSTEEGKAVYEDAKKMQSERQNDKLDALDEHPDEDDAGGASGTDGGTKTEAGATGAAGDVSDDDADLSDDADDNSLGLNSTDSEDSDSDANDEEDFAL